MDAARWGEHYSWAYGRMGVEKNRWRKGGEALEENLKEDSPGFETDEACDARRTRPMQEARRRRGAARWGEHYSGAYGRMGVEKNRWRKGLEERPWKKTWRRAPDSRRPQLGVPGWRAESEVVRKGTAERGGGTSIDVAEVGEDCGRGRGRERRVAGIISRSRARCSGFESRKLTAVEHGSADRSLLAWAADDSE
ncbi:hypothetical protein C8J57DRAFT_1603540 [Mycena rebaudengoi]|nr:hypothetical protein C8J57DRAFT_1603540 [Mycena rebaudengoi]